VALLWERNRLHSGQTDPGSVLALRGDKDQVPALVGLTVKSVQVLSELDKHRPPQAAAQCCDLHPHTQHGTRGGRQLV
jgi:hypothetical protein